MRKNENMSYEQLPLILDVKDIQKILGISRVRAYELCHKDGFPAIRISTRRIKILKEAFFEWLDNQSNCAGQ